MAEGDTVLRIARRIGEALSGAEVGVRAPNPRGRAAGVERLDGRRLDRVEARGKNLLFAFGDLALHSHLGMSGAWHLYPHGAAWRRPARTAWAVLTGDAGCAAQFGGPTLRVLSEGELKLDPVLSRLGPDILAPQFDPEDAAGRLRSDPGRALGDVLLDQSLVAGIGNIFKSEACFAAALDPRRAVGGLSQEELRSVLCAAREQMEAAAAGGRRPGSVYQRAGRPCPRCRTPIAALGQGDSNRTTYWCPGCQGA